MTHPLRGREASISARVSLAGGDVIVILSPVFFLLISDMDLSSLDQGPGTLFSNKVRSLFGAPLFSPSLDDARSFWLIATFSRSRF
jgi:hypothetical protein